MRGRLPCLGEGVLSMGTHLDIGGMLCNLGEHCGGGALAMVPN